MEKDITLKEFKEAKARLKAQIENYVNNAIMDFHKTYGCKVCGQVYIGWRVAHLEIGKELWSYPDIYTELKID